MIPHAVVHCSMKMFARESRIKCFQLMSFWLTTARCKFLDQTMAMFQKCPAVLNCLCIAKRIGATSFIRDVCIPDLLNAKHE